MFDGSTNSTPSRSIRAVGNGFTGQGGVANTNLPTLVPAPALLALQQNMIVPYFDGTEGRWIPFLKEWSKWSAYSLVGVPPQLEDLWKRDLFLTCLHKNLKEHYENLITLNPAMTYNALFDDLERSFSMDNPHYFRSEWEKLQFKSNEKLTLAEFFCVIRGL